MTYLMVHSARATIAKRTVRRFILLLQQMLLQLLRCQWFHYFIALDRPTFIWSLNDHAWVEKVQPLPGSRQKGRQAINHLALGTHWNPTKGVSLANTTAHGSKYSQCICKHWILIQWFLWFISSGERSPVLMTAHRAQLSSNFHHPT